MTHAGTNASRASGASASRGTTGSSNQPAAPARASGKATDIVRIGGADLVRTREANGEVTYRPVDSSTGAVVDAATFEQRKKEAREAKLRDDHRASDREASKWAADMRGSITKSRMDEARRLKREDAEQREKNSGGANPRRRAKTLGVVKPSKVLEELREEMRVAETTNLKTKNIGKFQFLKAALDLEEEKYAKLVDAARKRDYAKARQQKGVRGDAGLDAELSSGDEDDVPRIRGSLADLDDPDYRRGPAPGLKAAMTAQAIPAVPVVKASQTAAATKGTCRRCKLPGHFARDCMAIEEDLPELVASVQALDIVEEGEKKTIPKPNIGGAPKPKAPKKKSNGAKPAKSNQSSLNADADDPDYRRGPPQTNLSQKPVAAATTVGKVNNGKSASGKGHAKKTAGNGVLVFSKDTSSG